MTRTSLILKGVLMHRKLTAGYSTKEDVIKDTTMIFDGSEDSAIVEWIDWLREELSKTPEQREAESEKFIEELAEREAMQEYEERMSRRHDRDEWDDFWADRARDCGAIF